MVTSYKLYYIYGEISNQMSPIIVIYILMPSKMSPVNLRQEIGINLELSMISSLPNQFRNVRMKEYIKKDRIVR